MSTVKKEQEPEDPDEQRRQERIKNKPLLESCFNLMDFEAVARRVMKKTAWAYYSSGADDEIVEYLVGNSHYLLTINRLCEKTILHITRYGFGHEYSKMSPRLTSPQRCSEQKLTYRST